MSASSEITLRLALAEESEIRRRLKERADARIAALVKEGLGSSLIAERMGCSTYKVQDIRRRMSIGA